MDLNRVQLTGRLAIEPLLYDVGDHPVAALHLACEGRRYVEAGRFELTHNFYRRTAWEELANECGRCLHAGDRIYVVGQLRLFSFWSAGVEHTTHEIVLERMVLLDSAIPHAENPRRATVIRARIRSVAASVLAGRRAIPDTANHLGQEYSC